MITQEKAALARCSRAVRVIWLRKVKPPDGQLRVLFRAGGIHKLAGKNDKTPQQQQHHYHRQPPPPPLPPLPSLLPPPPQQQQLLQNSHHQERHNCNNVDANTQRFVCFFSSFSTE